MKTTLEIAQRDTQQIQAAERADVLHGPPDDAGDDMAIDDYAQQILDERESDAYAADLVEQIATDEVAVKALLRLSRGTPLNLAALDDLLARLRRGVEDAAEAVAESAMNPRPSREYRLRSALSALIHALDGEPTHDLERCLANARQEIQRQNANRRLYGRAPTQ